MIRLAAVLGLAILAAGVLSAAAGEPPAGWKTGSPRAEISPRFSYDPQGGVDGKGSFTISADTRPGLQGYWCEELPVQGGSHYKFTALHREENVPTPRRSVVARILWRDDHGKEVPQDGPIISHYLANWTSPPAGIEFPLEQGPNGLGWNVTAGVVRAPAKATRAIIELDFQWATDARAEWCGVSFVACPAPPPRTVRLAAVHFMPSGGKTPMDNCRMYAPLVAEAARQKADLVVLGETLTSVDVGSFADVAEPIPGPSSNFFGELAKQHGLYLVAGLVERDGRLIYNTAVLLGPDGVLVGKYRKTAPAGNEIEQGITPGRDYPVFNTRFGRVGIMICYDGFFPDAARHLCEQGAEVIAWPVWGCDPRLAVARADENQVYLVSSTYEDAAEANWGISGVYDREGKIIAQAKRWGTVAVAEVDLNQPTHWTSLGNWRNALPRHRPDTR